MRWRSRGALCNLPSTKLLTRHLRHRPWPSEVAMKEEEARYPLALNPQLAESLAKPSRRGQGGATVESMLGFCTPKHYNRKAASHVLVYRDTCGDGASKAKLAFEDKYGKEDESYVLGIDWGSMEQTLHLPHLGGVCLGLERGFAGELERLERRRRKEQQQRDVAKADKKEEISRFLFHHHREANMRLTLRNKVKKMHRRVRNLVSKTAGTVVLPKLDGLRKWGPKARRLGLGKLRHELVKVSRRDGPQPHRLAAHPPAPLR